jgi:uncharacterized protein (DUF1330 family)
MPAYVIAQVEVTDWERYREYTKHTPETIARHGGRAIARADAAEILEGPEDTRRVVILEFPTVEAGRGWYESPEYQAVREIRLGASTGALTLVEGLG